MMRYTEVSWRI